MQFIHTIVHEVIGTTASSEADTVLLDDPPSRVWACLTRNPDPHCVYADENLAVSTMLLQGLTGTAGAGSFGERLANEAERIRAERELRKKGRTYIVLRREGEIEDWKPEEEHEGDDFVVRLNGAPDTDIQEVSRNIFASLILSLSLVVQQPVQIRRYRESVALHRADGIRVFAKSLVLPPVTVARSFPGDAVAAVRRGFDALVGLRDLSRVVRLFVASLESTDDPLRSFLAGWTALEMFVNKAFSTYEKELLSEVQGGALRKDHASYITGLRAMVGRKYPLIDKFSFIAFRLAPERAQEDVLCFKSAKRSRDKLAHGLLDDETTLPIAQVHELLKRYIERHAASARDR